MSTIFKTLGIFGAGALVAFGISTSVPNSTTTTAPSAVIAPETMKTTASKPVFKKTVSEPVVSEIKPTSNCHPSYSGCLKMNAGDYDCASGSGNGPNYTGPVEVYNSDPFDLDRDNDGWGCE